MRIFKKNNTPAIRLNGKVVGRACKPVRTQGICLEFSTLPGQLFPVLAVARLVGQKNTVYRAITGPGADFTLEWDEV